MAGMTADDINKLQVIQNSLNRLLTGARKGTPTKDLLERTDRMSIMQMVAYHTLTMVHKVIQTGKPEYIANKLEVVYGTELERRAWGGTTIRVPQYNLEVSRAGFIYRGANLFNSLTLSIREEKKTTVFKASAKKWVKEISELGPIDEHLV